MDWKSHRIDALLEQALLEDQAPHDATTHLTIDANLRAAGSIIAREELVVAGLGAIPRFFEIYARLDRSPEGQTRFEVVSHPEMFDGVRVHAGQVLAASFATTRACCSSCQRVILNLLQHMSGIATLTRQFADAIKAHTRTCSTRARLFPVCGLWKSMRYSAAEGLTTVSISLPEFSSRTITSRSAAAIATTLKRALAQRKNPGQRVQVSNSATRRELEEALAHGAEAILLDSMTPAEVRRSVDRIKAASAAEPGRWIPTEASGGIVLGTVRAYAETGVDFISVGALTHSARAADISMTIAAEHGHSCIRACMNRAMSPTHKFIRPRKSNVRSCRFPEAGIRRRRFARQAALCSFDRIDKLRRHNGGTRRHSTCWRTSWFRLFRR